MVASYLPKEKTLSGNDIASLTMILLLINKKVLVQFRNIGEAL